MNFNLQIRFGQNLILAKVLLLNFILFPTLIWGQADSSSHERKECFVGLAYTVLQMPTLKHILNPSLGEVSFIRPQGLDFSIFVRHTLKKNLFFDFTYGAMIHQFGAYIEVDTTKLYPLGPSEDAFWFKNDYNPEIAIARGRLVSFYTGAGVSKRVFKTERQALNFGLNSKLVLVVPSFNGGISKFPDYTNYAEQPNSLSFVGLGEYNDYSSRLLVIGDVIFLSLTARVDYSIKLFTKLKMMLFFEATYSGQPYYKNVFFANRAPNRFIFESQSVLNFIQPGITFSL